MGAGLVMAAYSVANRIRLDHVPTRMFVFMAASAVDGDPQPAFWKGRDSLAHSIGKSGATGHRAAGRALDLLSEAGLIACISRSAPGGRNAKYALLDGTGLPLSVGGDSLAAVDSSEATHSPPNGGDSVANGGDSVVKTEATQSPVEEKEENKEEGAPPEFCSKHPAGTSAPCGACGDARRAARAWRPPKRAPRTCIHSFDPTSGYCNRCGTREDQA